MILEMATSAMLSHGALSSRAISETAQHVAKQSEQGWTSLQKSHLLGLGAKGVFNELQKVAKECRYPGWAGYASAPVTEVTVAFAFNFLGALPLGMPAPTVGAEPDGHLTLEWYRSPRHTLSVSISPEGELHYAALMAHSKTYGTEPFFGDIPQIILDLIYRLGSK